MLVADKDQQVLLCVEYVVARDGIELDWNAVAKEVEPFLTGEAIKQHLSKLRAARDIQGQTNPPKLDRKTIVAARKKSNPLLDVPKTPKTSKRSRVQKNDDDDWNGENEAPKSGPKTAGLLYIDKKVKSTPRKRKIKQEPEDEMGCFVSQSAEGDEDEAPRAVPASTPSKKKKRTFLAPNFPQEPPSSPAEAPLLGAPERAWSLGPWQPPQDWAVDHATGGGVEEIVPMQRARGGTWLEAPPGLTFGGDGAPAPVFDDVGYASLPSMAGGASVWEPFLEGNEFPGAHLGFGGLFGLD